MFSGLVDKISRRAIDALAPPHCHWCGIATENEPVCAGCREALPWNGAACRACAIPLSAGPAVCGECLKDSPPQDRTWAAFRYATPVDRAIVELKFHGRLASAHVIGTLMARAIAARTEPLPELLIPVPLHPARLRQRGYNQAMELARGLTRQLQIPLAPDGARRLRSTAEQSRLDAVARRRNVHGAFEVRSVVRGRHVALLDDVITTGATVREFAGAALDAGARRVEVWAAARVA